MTRETHLHDGLDGRPGNTRLWRCELYRDISNLGQIVDNVSRLITQDHLMIAYAKFPKIGLAFLLLFLGDLHELANVLWDGLLFGISHLEILQDVLLQSIESLAPKIPHRRRRCGLRKRGRQVGIPAFPSIIAFC